MTSIRERFGLREAPYDTQEVYGIEIEYESAHNVSTPPTGWEYHEDHSLRGGGEWVLSTPLQLNDLEQRLRVACDQLTRQGASHSTRTSIHVHMNVRDLTPAQVHKLVQVCIALDPALFAMTSPQREHNNFALGQAYCGSSTARLLSSLGLLRINDLPAGARMQSRSAMAELLSSLRYGSINLAPLFRFGTVEFRHMAGTNDFGTILRYVRTLSAIRRRVVDAGFRTADELVCLAQGNVPNWLPGPLAMAFQESEGLTRRVAATAEMALISEIPYRTRAGDHPHMVSSYMHVQSFLRAADTPRAAAPEDEVPAAPLRRGTVRRNPDGYTFSFQEAVAVTEALDRIVTGDRADQLVVDDIHQVFNGEYGPL